MRPTTPLVIAALLLAGGCGSSHRAGKDDAKAQCRAVIGFEAATGTPLGGQQLALARLAIANDNSAHDTRISLAIADTRSTPSLAAVASDRFAVQPRVVAVVGPASSAEVSAVGPIFARAGLPFVSGSATGASLTAGANPTFFRVVPSDNLQGPELARFVLARLHARAVTVVDGQDAYARQLVGRMLANLRLARLPVDHQLATPGVTLPSLLVARIPHTTTAVVLAWHASRSAEQVGRILLQQRRLVNLVGPDRLYAPGAFTVPGAYVTAYAPDITALPGDGVIARQAGVPSAAATLGAPVYAATHVIDEAIAAVCGSGQAPSRSGVLAAIRATNDPSSILDLPVRFRSDGELADARWFVYRITPAGDYGLILSS